MKQQEKIKYLLAQASQKSKILNFPFVIFFFIFLFLNINSSQSISSIYFGFISNNEKSTVSFLQKIKDLPDYQKILEMSNDIYGEAVKEEIYAQENKKKEMINNLEQKLLINPRARDILYSLYQLYMAEEDSNRASEYLRRAKEVDPGIK